MPQDQTREFELHDYLRVLSRRKWIVISAVVVCVGLSLVLSFLQEPTYRATARLLIQKNPAESPFDVSTGQLFTAQRSLDTEIQVLRSQLVQAEVRRQLGSAPGIEARSVGDTDVIAVTAVSTDPKRAADTANAYTGAYISFRRKQTVDGLLAATEELQRNVTDIQKQIDDLDAQVNAAPAANQDAVRTTLSTQRGALVEQLSLFKSTIDKLRVDANLTTGGAQLVGAAVVPTSPFRPQPVRNGVLAGMIGLLLGVGLAYLVEYLDDSIKSKEELERILGGVAVLGVIPAVEASKTKEGPGLISRDDPQSAAAEAYRTLRTSTQFAALDRPMVTLQITSPSAGDGKTTTLANLGVALATAGQQVILVDCDLRRPRLHTLFRLPNDVGFTSVLLGEVPLSRALQPAPETRRLRVVTSGPLPPNPSELLSSDRAAEVFAALAAEGEIVLIDSPPVLPVTDALVLFRHVDATIMVFSAQSTTRKQASGALSMARQVDGPLIGAVLNALPAGRDGYGYSYAYAYGYGYGEDRRSSGPRNGRATTEAPAARGAPTGSSTAPENGSKRSRSRAPS